MLKDNPQVTEANVTSQIEFNEQQIPLFLDEKAAKAVTDKKPWIAA